MQPIVEARLDLETEPQSPTHPDHAPDQPLRATAHRHEILNLAHTLPREKPRDQDIGFRKVELLARSARIHRRDPVKAASIAIQQRPEHTRPVEPIRREPIDRAVTADQRRGAQVACLLYTSPSPRD